MHFKKFYYHNLGFWFLLFIALVAVAFYRTYFISILQPTPALIHFHFVLMALWLLMLIAQPFLIKYKKLKWHRVLGKASYVLVPLVLITAFLLIRENYYRDIHSLTEKVAQGMKQLTADEILIKAAETPIGIIYFIWFAVFYVLAIKNLRQSSKHARYMLATALTLTGPTVDRILSIYFNINTIAGISSYIVSFILIDLVLGLLLFADYKNRKETGTLLTCVIIYTVGQLLYFVVPSFNWWSVVMKYIMMPQP